MASLDPAVIPHVQHIRDALWRDEAATVMVGAGFSLNAEPLVPGARNFPLWDALANEMAREIELNDGRPRDPLRIAQMYASTRGRVELDRLIERNVPDLEWRPGELHRHLLDLPWADVFTTNYDTLLERARDESDYRVYEIIRAPIDIPMRRQPRIVKLHGTIGGGQSFIITEEDYRSYPRKFPAFVNLVQGAVMETVLVLIGFAGDDPNFLEWTGWVRDVLGDQAPRIYLGGVFDATAAEQATCRARGVTMVDLGVMFPSALGPQRHFKALKWLLGEFEGAQPLRHENWAPTESIVSTQTTIPLPPTATLTPFARSPSASPSRGSEASAEELHELSRVWAAQRAEYPGWHVAPNPIRQRIWHTTSRWRSIVFSRSKSLSTEERLTLLRELCWRLELSLSPVFTDECDELVKCLEQVDPFGGRLGIANAKILQGASVARLAKAWQELALHVLRTAREDLDESRFNTWFDRLSLVGAEDASLGSELAYEKTLWHLNALDLGAYRKALAAWRSGARQPLEFLRLASCHAELGDGQLATELASTAIKGARRHGRTPEAMSMEAWGCLLLHGLLRFGSESEQMRETRERLAKAKKDGYDPWEIVREIESDLTEPRPKQRPERERVAGFDAGAITETHHFGSDEESLMPAFRLTRLLERAPYPIRAGHVNFLGTSAAHAAVWLQQASTSWSLSTLLRCGAPTEIVQEHFHRAAIATLSVERVQRLCDVLLRVIDEALERISKREAGVPDDMGLRMAKAAMELLSRVAMRAPEPTLRRSLATCMTWLSSPEVASRHDFNGPLGNLVNRVGSSLSEDLVIEAVIGFLGTPMPGEGTFNPRIAEHWPDGLPALWNRSPKRPNERGIHWAKDWDRILQGIRSDNSTLRSVAFDRGHFLFSNGWLGASEVDQLATAFWSQIDSSTELPKIRADRLSWLLYTAQALERDVAGKLRQYLLVAPLPAFRNENGSFDIGRMNATQGRLEDLCAVFSPECLVGPDTVVLSLDESETIELLEKLHGVWPSLLAFLNRPHARRFALGGSPDKLARVAAKFLGDVLLLNLPRGHPRVAMIEEMLGDLHNADVPTQSAVVGRLFQSPVLLSAVDADLERILVGNDEIPLRVALDVLGSWSRAARAGLVCSVPAVLVDRVIGRFSLRKAPCLDSAVKCLVTWIENDPDILVEAQRNWLISGLDQIVNETEPSLLNKEFGLRNIDGVAVMEALHLRAWAGVLASALATALQTRGMDIPQVLERWKALCARDPLPELRAAWDARSR